MAIFFALMAILRTSQGTMFLSQPLQVTALNALDVSPMLEET